jgi:hypothetical protein
LPGTPPSGDVELVSPRGESELGTNPCDSMGSCTAAAAAASWTSRSTVQR